jgi:integrase
MSLNDLACRHAKPQAKAYRLYDSGGLYLDVMPTGNRYWRLKYRFQAKEKLLTIGRYPIISLITAREKRDAAKQSLVDGIDPGEAKQEKKRLARYNAEQTFEVVARDWHKRFCDTWSKRHSDNILYRLQLDVFPQIGRLPISSITPRHVLDCLQKIEDRGAHEMARRSLQMCGQVFRYAVITGRAQRDVTVDLKGALKRYKRGHYAAIDVDELPELVKALNRNEARLFKQTLLAIRLMLLTFVRTSELIEAQWEEFDLDKAVWNIPAQRMKMRLPHMVPLATQAVAILKELKEMNGGRHYVFPSITKPSQPMSNNTILMALKRMGYRGKMTGHGFRALAMSSIKEKLGYQHEVVDRQLAHVPKNAVDRAYDRAKFIPQRVQMMQAWADYIDSIA